MVKPRPGKIEKQCQFCNGIFLARRDRLGKYCSRACNKKAHPIPRDRIDLECGNCNAIFTVKKYRVKSAKYCSLKCLSISRGRMFSKENHPRWKGGKARSWSSKIVIKKLIKEIGKCQACEATTNLQGHHIVAYSKNELLRDSENNIQILCRLCHSNKHPEMANFILKGMK